MHCRKVLLLRQTISLKTRFFCVNWIHKSSAKAFYLALLPKRNSRNLPTALMRIWLVLHDHWGRVSVCVHVPPGIHHFVDYVVRHFEAGFLGAFFKVDKEFFIANCEERCWYSSSVLVKKSVIFHFAILSVDPFIQWRNKEKGHLLPIIKEESLQKQEKSWK